MTAARWRRSRGFTLLETMTVVGLLGFISVVTSHLFRATVKTWHETAARQTAETRFDSALRQLREDVWSASSITTTNNHALLLRRPGAPDVGWTSISPGVLTRVEVGESAPREWAGIGGFTFEVSGPNVTVTEAGDQESKVVLTSQAMLFPGETR